MELGRLGVFFFNEGIPARDVKSLVRRFEGLGYSAVWLPEATGREPFASAAMILEATERLIAATGIVNLYNRDPLVSAMGQQTLAEMSGGRFLLGLGVSHSFFVEARGHAYGRPLQTMREYVAALKQCHTEMSVTRNLLVEGLSPQNVSVGSRGAITADVGELPIVLAALGPKMTALAGEIAQGAHPYNTTPAHTARARAILGPGPWLCPAQRVALTNDARKARQVGRQLLALYLSLPNYRNMLLDSVYAEPDLEDGGSDRLVDQLLAWGDEETIRARVREHLDAGADHVCVQAVDLDEPGRPCLRTLEAIAGV